MITPASPTSLPAIRDLFRAYAATLHNDICTQGFDEEIASLPGQYAPPDGAAINPLPPLGGRGQGEGGA